MKRKSLLIITTLMTLALLGVFAMQLYYIKEAYNLKSQLFEQNVNQALNSVVSKVQKRYAASHISRKAYEKRKEREQDFRRKAQEIVDYKEHFKEEELKRKRTQKRKIIDNLNLRDSLVRITFMDAKMISEEAYQAISNLNDPRNSPLQVQVDFNFDSFGNVRGNINQSIEIKNTPTFSLEPDDLPDSIRYLAFNPRKLRPMTITLERLTPDMALKFKIEDKLAEQKYKEGLKSLMQDTLAWEDGNLNYLRDVEMEMNQANVPIEKRVHQDDLDTLLKKELLNKGINIDYSFWLKLANKDSLLYSQAALKLDEEDMPVSNTYKIPLFGNDIFRDPGMLYVYFPRKNSLIIGNMWATMASSAGLLLVLVFIFTYTLYAIIRQKKISEMKTDFINNMTHEFKTPVSTIMIASEALKDPEIVEDTSRINRLANIIYDENVRLGNHIERVLSIARLEKREIKLEQQEVNVNELIMAVTDSMALQLQKKHAKLSLQLEAENPVILGDELHLSNVIYNLIDNANKYSLDEPRIEVRTWSNAKSLFIAVKDEGMGMTKEQTRRIFDQFYRVPTGNLHDVKGFGLGLNYVQDIINQMGGTVKVQSEKDKGTKFEINLPLNQN